MQYGPYYAVPRPADGDSGNTHVTVYKGAPGTDEAQQVAGFTVTEAQEEEYGTLDRAIYAYMRELHPRRIGERHGLLTCVEVIESEVAIWEGCGLQYTEDLDDGSMALVDTLAFLRMIMRIGHTIKHNPKKTNNEKIPEVYLSDDGKRLMADILHFPCSVFQTLNLKNQSV